MSDSSPPSSPDASSVVRVILRDRKARPFFGRHPWVFESAIAGVEVPDGEEPAAGTVVELWSAKQEFIAYGLWNSHSKIKVRLYSWDREKSVDADLLTARLKEAVALRRRYFALDSEGVACRLVFSEGDQLSGLTVDFYAGYLLLQFTSLGLFQFRDIIVAALQNEVAARGVWMRTEKGMREVEGLEVVDGLISGDQPPRPLFIQEHGVQYGVDVQEGQKTGCYLDQRDNRLVAAKFLQGEMLDAFCFSGGFGITAAVQDTVSTVTGIDSSEPALVLARANAELNAVADRCRYQKGDVRAELSAFSEQGRQFDSVVLDPPRMARTRGGLNRAVKGYHRLNMAGLAVLRPGGTLVTCSCSGLVTPDVFREMIADVARESGRVIQILAQCGQPVDHPVSATCAETEYLKVLICRVL